MRQPRQRALGFVGRAKSAAQGAALMGPCLSVGIFSTNHLVSNEVILN